MIALVCVCVCVDVVLDAGTESDEQEQTDGMTSQLLAFFRCDRHTVS